MAWTTPTTVNPGDAILASLWNEQVRDNLTEVAPFFGAWTSYTPQLDQGVSNIAKTVLGASYLKIGTLVVVRFTMQTTASGTSNNNLNFNVPTGLNPVGAFNQALGVGSIYDTSTSTTYAVTWTWVNASQHIVATGDWSGAGAWGTNPNLAIASGDLIRGMLMYETT